MQNITLGAAGSTILWLAAVAGGIGALYVLLRNLLKKILEEEFKAIKDRIDDIDEKLKKADMEACKNFLVRYLADVEKGTYTSEIENQRFWEEYEHYKQMGGNSYIREWATKLQKKGYL